MPPTRSSRKKTFRFTINDIPVKGKDGETVLDVAKRYAIDIPHLCAHPRLENIGACRMCIVEVDGKAKPVTSCTTFVREGMVVKTHTPQVLHDRRETLKLILANHNYECVSCSQNLQCKLQAYAHDLGIREVPFKDGETRKWELDTSSVSIKRDTSKCILCQRCIRMCQNIQTVNAIGLQNRGFHTKVAPPLSMDMQSSACVNCGQCVVVCPTGALSERSDIDKAVKALNSDKHLVVQTAPSIRAALGEEFGMEPGTPVTGKMVAALKELGFDDVFDTDLAADITIMEEATEFVKRFRSGKDLPLITTCCPAWVKFGEQFFFEQLNHMSTCKSPQAMMGSLVKNYYAKKKGINPKDIIMVDIMPCTAKKFEIEREELEGDTDIVLTTVELARLIKLFDVDFKNLPDAEFDKPLGLSSGAGDIFGRSGGVMEAALRTAVDWISGKDLRRVNYKSIRGSETFKEGEVSIKGHTIKVAVVHTLGEARKLMDMIRAGTCPYHFIEIMACYGGCIGGGGQPRYEEKSVIEARAGALDKEDSDKAVRKSHKNKAVIDLYDEYLGKPGGKRAHKLLHTHYVEREFL
ncbi:MAG: NADH-dependent [FeFe] hydrogenase, group A6 [Candidatus Woesearchaeota archaeon]